MSIRGFLVVRFLVMYSLLTGVLLIAHVIWPELGMLYGGVVGTGIFVALMALFNMWTSQFDTRNQSEFVDDAEIDMVREMMMQEGLEKWHSDARTERFTDRRIFRPRSAKITKYGDRKYLIDGPMKLHEVIKSHQKH